MKNTFMTKFCDLLILILMVDGLRKKEKKLRSFLKNTDFNELNFELSNDFGGGRVKRRIKKIKQEATHCELSVSYI